MHSKRSRRVQSTIVAFLALSVAFLLVRPLLADDYEDPWYPIPGPTISESGEAVPFGDLTVTVSCVGGPLIDIKATIEPQITALLIVGGGE